MKSICNFILKICRRRKRNDDSEPENVKRNTGGDAGTGKSNRATRNLSKREKKRKSSTSRQTRESQRISTSKKFGREEGSRKNKDLEKKLQQSEENIYGKSSEVYFRGRSRREESHDMSGKSLGRLRNLSGRVSRRVMTFVSRPVRELAIRRFISKIEARRLAEMDNSWTRRELRPGQVAYPRSRGRSLERLRNGPDQVFADALNPEITSQLPSTSVAEEISSDKKKSAELVTGNNDNNGAVIVNGVPFWVAEENPQLIDREDSDTDDELPLSADIVLDVHRGNLKLDKMPAIPVVLDPLDDLRKLQKRDKLFFTKTVLFGNSVRSMINLSDTTSMKISRKRSKISTLSFNQPDTRFLYLRERFWELVEDPYTPTCTTRAEVNGRRKGSLAGNTNKRQKGLAQPEVEGRNSSNNEGAVGVQ